MGDARQDERFQRTHVIGNKDTRSLKVAEMVKSFDLDLYTGTLQRTQYAHAASIPAGHIVEIFLGQPAVVINVVQQSGIEEKRWEGAHQRTRLSWTGPVITGDMGDAIGRIVCGAFHGAVHGVLSSCAKMPVG